MALSDILQTIEQETEKKIAEIKKDGELQREKLQKELDQDLEKKKEALLGRIEQRADKKVAQAAWEFSSRTQTAVLKKKQQLLDEVFTKALAKFGELSEGDYVATVTGLFKSLPEIEAEATILPAKGKEEATKKAASAAGVKYTFGSDTVDSVGGFVVQTANMNVDMTFESLVRMYRSDHESDVAAKLFSK